VKTLKHLKRKNIQYLFPAEATDTPTSSTANETPTSSTANETPTSSTANETPTSSKANETPTSSTANETPTSSKANETPSASTINETQTASTALDDEEFLAGLLNIEEFLTKASKSHPNFHINYLIMQQQLKIMKDSLLPAQQNSPSTITKTIADILKPPTPPQRAGVHRNYKLPNHGGMNSIEMLAKQEEAIKAKEKVEEEKAERKKQREVNKEIREKVLKMKKEKAEETKAARKRKAEDEELDEIVVKKRGKILKMKKAEETKAAHKRKAEIEETAEVVVKKRGRPSKAATDQAEPKSGRKAPIRVMNSIVPKKNSKK
jgi:hypothetical protein